MTIGPAPQLRSARFVRRRSQILDAAAAEINLLGTRGMTLTAVAKALGLDTSSVTYYFKRKELLAAACLERTLEWLLEQARSAAEKRTPVERVRTLIHAALALHERQRPTGVSRLAVLSDMGSLDNEVRAPLDALYAATFRVVRGYFDTLERSASRFSAMALLAVIHWMPAWIDNYLIRDFARIEDRLTDLCENGLGFPIATNSEPVLELEQEDAQTRFLHTATYLINSHGYHGASVERISAELGVSVGSFYHHLENKDDLVIACFERTFGLLERAHIAGEAGGGSHGDRLGRVLLHLLRLQLGGPSPLLRTGAYQALPPTLRSTMLGQAERISRHLAGSIADGASDGSIRTTDPLIAAHFLLAIVSTVSGLRDWAERNSIDQAVEVCSRTLSEGLISSEKGAESETDDNGLHRRANLNIHIGLTTSSVARESEMPHRPGL